MSESESQVPEGQEQRRRRSVRTGVVVSAKMQKTVVVAVQRSVTHPLYRKTLRRTTTFLVHDEMGARQGDQVRIVETRPLSRHKRWRVQEILKRAPVFGEGSQPVEASAE
jgi:small subunit ribosomal protein S17